MTHIAADFLSVPSHYAQSAPESNSKFRMSARKYFYSANAQGLFFLTVAQLVP